MLYLHTDNFMVCPVIYIKSFPTLSQTVFTNFLVISCKQIPFQIEYDMLLKILPLHKLEQPEPSINRTHKTNAAKRIDNGYNEYQEFHQQETEAHICAAFMVMGHMSTLTGY